MDVKAEILHDTPEVQVSRELAPAGGTVVVKRVRHPEDVMRVARLHYEYTMLQQLAEAQVAGVVQPVEYVRTPNVAALTLVDIAGFSLRKQHAAQPLSIDEILYVSVEVCQALSGVHRAGITHKDINPSNVVFNRQSGVVQLIDFEIASRLAQESPWTEPTRGFHGTPAFASPEQTGHMNRPIDWRTDLYSWGASLYDLLTGQVPFSGNMRELIYSILAREPPPITSLNPECPPQLARVVERLMAKAPERRYQSAQGARDDLQRCRDAWQARRQIEPFELGSADRSERFELGERLHGRRGEVAVLEAAYQRAASGTCEIVWLSGPSGIGKSALVGEVQQSMAQHGALLLSGKYDQLRRHVPFNALTDAVATFVRRILAEPQEVVDSWRQTLGGALGNIGQALIDIAPSLELLLGPQKALHDGGTQVNDNRFILAVLRFLSALSTHQPLVLFLDDLQWADSGSYRLLRALQQGEGGGAGLLIIGAFRDNEVDAQHPLSPAMARSADKRATMSALHVAPLNEAAIVEIVCDATRNTPEVATPLAQLVLAKTAGNPFFVREFLRALASKQLLHYDPAADAWRWDLATVGAANVTDNVAQLMSERLAELTPASKRVLSYAAALGNEFDLSTLATVLQEDRLVCVTALLSPLQLGLIVALVDTYRYADQSTQNINYKFTHDQIQSAAYRLLDADATVRCHYDIGRRLLAAHSNDATSHWLLPTLGHINRGAALMSLDERAAAVLLNRQGAMAAKKAAAYNIAVDALRRAIDYLGGDEAWQINRSLAWELHLDLAGCCLLANETAAAAAENALALQWAASPSETARAHRQRSEALASMGQAGEAIRVGLLGLRALGLHYSADAGLGALVQALLALHVSMLGKKVEDLINLPPIHDARISEITALLTTLAISAYFTNPMLFGAMSLTRARLSIRHGMTAGTPHALAMVAVAYGQVGDYVLARRYAKVAQACAARLPFAENGPSVQVVYGLFCAHGHMSPIDVSESCAENALLTLEAGSPSEAWACAMSGIISDCLSAPQTGRERVGSWFKNLPINSLQERHWYTTATLAPRVFLGESPDLLTWHSTAAEDAAFETAIGDKNAGLACMAYCLLRVMTSWMGRDARGAVGYALWGFKAGCLEKMGDQSMALFAIISLLAVSDEAVESRGESFQGERRRLFRASWRKLRIVAKDGPKVYGGVIPWIQALRAMARGQMQKAAQLYETATRALRGSGYAMFMAAAHECAGRFYLAEGGEAPARGHLAAAIEAYEVWGVTPKATQLKQAFRTLLAAEKRTTITVTHDAGTRLDLPTILLAAQALGGETSEAALVQKVVDALVEQSGATRALFVACERDGMHVVHDSAAPETPSADMPRSILELVRRSGEALLCDDPAQTGEFAGDTYLEQHRPRAVLCAPVLRQGQTRALLYLENRLIARAFRADHLILVQVLAAQVAVSLESARLAGHLEAEVRTRTADLRAMHAKVVELEKAGTEVRLAGGFAHEMRNALHPAGLALQTLQKDEEWAPHIGEALLTQAQAAATNAAPVIQQALEWSAGQLRYNQDLLRAASQAVNRAMLIIEQILLYASATREHAGDEQVPFLPLAARLQASLAPRLQQLGTTLQVEAPPSALHLAIKDDHAYVVLSHLLRNACDALEGRDAPSIILRGRITDACVQLEVQDNGHGMSPEVQSRLYEPFFSTKGSHGTGLGLGICKRLVELYGGRIELHSQVRQGSTVKVLLPISAVPR